MDRSRLLKPAGVAVMSVLVGILASIGNEVVLVNLLVVLIGIFVIWKQNQVLYYLLQERNHVVPLHQVPVSKNSKSTKNKHLNEKNVYSESRDAQKPETLSNGKNKQSKGKNTYLDNSEVQKKENFSKMESKQPKESSEKLMLEVRMSGMKYTSGYLEMCKYFEEIEDDAVRDKKVRLACELRHQGFDLDKVIDAARNCDNFDTATRYLMQKCDSCAKFFSLPEIVQMFMCTHKLCKGCIKNHVAKAMKGRNILDCTCKVCEMPKLEFEDKALEYLSTLDCYLESILPSEVHQQFHRELMSGTWKTRLKSKESKPSSQHEVNGSWQTAPTKQRGNSSSQSTGPITRSQTQGARNSSAANLSTTQFETSSQNEANGGRQTTPKRQRGNTSSQNTGAKTRSQMQAVKNSNLTSTKIEGSTGTTAENDNDRPKFGSRFNMNSTDLPISGSDSSCSFCGAKTYLPYKMISCEHKLCRSCTTTFFSQLILTADITDCVCPVCRKPEFHSQEDFFNYFKDFRKNLSDILNAGMRESLEKKFKVFIENLNGDYGTHTKSYADDKRNERDNCNQLQRTCLHNKTPVKECASKLSSEFSSRNSLNNYVEKRQTTCPNCRVHCDLTRQYRKLVECHKCEVSFCESCKAFYKDGIGRIGNSRQINNHFHLHKICSHKKDRFGIEKLKLILEKKEVNFVDTEPESGVCLLREVYLCKNKPFRSDLCRYHYEDYLANLLLPHYR